MNPYGPAPYRSPILRTETESIVAASAASEPFALLGVVCAFLLVAGCASGGHSDPRPIPAAWTSEVLAVGEQGHSGFATVTVLPDLGTRANLTLSGGTAGGRHPWHIHEGRCGEDAGGPVGPADAYPLLQPDERGNASATASLAATLDGDEAYHINVHHSLEDPTIVGCGELILAD